MDPAWAGMPGSGVWPKMVPWARFPPSSQRSRSLESRPVERAHGLAQLEADDGRHFAGADYPRCSTDCESGR